jgi:DNA polymerase-3 subunit beta
VGESQESLPVAYTGDVLEIGFNADFLRDGLELLDSDDVRVKLISPLRPAVIQGEGDDFTYLVMPIRLPG